MKKALQVLVVEDDNVDQMLLRRLFAKMNLESSLVFAENGEDALRILREETEKKLSPSFLIVTDLNMPKMGGLELLKALREDKKLASIVVYVLTTSISESDITEAYKYNIAGYITKDQLREKTDEVVALLSSYTSLNIFPPPS